jgi:hypothetical protein
MNKVEYLTIIVDMNPNYWFKNPQVASEFFPVFDIFINAFLSLSSQNNIRIYLYDSHSSELIFDSILQKTFIQLIGTDYELLNKEINDRIKAF